MRIFKKIKNSAYIGHAFADFEYSDEPFTDLKLLLDNFVISTRFALADTKYHVNMAFSEDIANGKCTNKMQLLHGASMCVAGNLYDRKAAKDLYSTVEKFISLKELTSEYSRPFDSFDLYQINKMRVVLDSPMNFEGVTLEDRTNINIYKHYMVLRTPAGPQVQTMNLNPQNKPPMPDTSDARVNLYPSKIFR